MRATVYPAADGWRWRMAADNGEIVATGEAYVRRRDAESALAQIVHTVELEVTIRGHSDMVIDHYKIGRYIPPPFDRGTKPTDTEGNSIEA